MHRILIVFALVCAPVLVWAQAIDDPPASPPSPPRADESLLPDQASQSPAPDDQLNRIERRPDQIESRIDRSNSEPAAVQSEAIPEAAAEPAAAADNTWRYRNHNGAWWYWLPSNRWVYWSNGAWADYSTETDILPPDTPSAESPTIYTSTPYSLPAHRYYAPTYAYYPSDYSYSSYYPSNGYGGYGGSYYPSYGYGGYGRYYGGHGLGIGLSFGGIGWGHSHGHHHHHGHGHRHHHGGHHHGGYHRHGGHHHH